MNWVSSSGGPLILLPGSLRAAWGGVRGGGRRGSDYDLACTVRGYAGAIHKDGHDILVLDDEPMDTTVVVTRGLPVLVRWIEAPSPEFVDRLLVDTIVPALGHSWNMDEVESFSIQLRDDRYFLMDAAESCPEQCEEVKIPPGKYRIDIFDYRKPEVRLLLYVFEPIAAATPACR